jgi:hypothetical protein
MGGDPFPEERAAATGSIEELVGEYDIARPDLLFERPDRVCGDDTFDAEHLETVDVRPIVDLHREKAVTAAVAAKESDMPALEPPDDICIRRIAKRSSQPMLLEVFYPLDLI